MDQMEKKIGVRIPVPEPVTSPLPVGSGLGALFDLEWTRIFLTPQYFALAVRAFGGSGSVGASTALHASVGVLPIFMMSPSPGPARYQDLINNVPFPP